jgi:hypothetical protein
VFPFSISLAANRVWTVFPGRLHLVVLYLTSALLGVNYDTSVGIKSNLNILKGRILLIVKTDVAVRALASLSFLVPPSSFLVSMGLLKRFG